MTDKQIKVGMLVPLADVPPMALVRDYCGDFFHWKHPSTSRVAKVTIIALDVPADATADDLFALIDQFKGRERLDEASHEPFVGTCSEMGGYDQDDEDE